MKLGLASSFFRLPSQSFVSFRDLQHSRLCAFVVYRVGCDADTFCSLAPVVGISSMPIVDFFCVHFALDPPSYSDEWSRWLRLGATGRGRLVECEIAPRMMNGEYSLGYSSSRMLPSVIGGRMGAGFGPSVVPSPHRQNDHDERSKHH